MAWLLWKAAWQVLGQTQDWDPANPLVGIYSEELATGVQAKTCT